MTSLNTPAFVLYRVEGDGKNAVWTKIGAAWPNRDGKGFSLKCEAVPLAGRMLLRAYEPKPKVTTGQNGGQS
ncbi:MAG TPA: hypothetical protein DCL54_19310 [Alphaproteobacteria bacterium]|jgi:hypothetical protein|nr:hypothetical protein [Alphaproteobacteria bacterium]